MGIPGTTAWLLVISVADPIPRTQISIPHAVRPDVQMESEEKCREVASAINEKASEAGVKQKLSADCREIEFIEIPKS